MNSRRKNAWRIALVAGGAGAVGVTLAQAASPTAAAPRDPFRPVGYRPAPAMAPEPPPPPPAPIAPAAPERTTPSPELWEEARRRVRVHGISRGGDRVVVVINGRVYGVGDRLELSYAGFVFRWSIEAIDEQGVRLHRVDESDGPGAGPLTVAPAP